MYYCTAQFLLFLLQLLKAIREIFHINSCHMLKNYFKQFIFYINCEFGVFVV